jgi:hypothetical protein
MKRLAFESGALLRTRLRGKAPCAGAVLLVLFCTRPLAAQFDAGQISGFVRDPSGLVVPGVTVTVMNEGNRQQREAVSNEDKQDRQPDDAADPAVPLLVLRRCR